MNTVRYTALAFATAACLATASGATAQSPPATTPTPAQQQELEAARAELDRAAKHYADLAREYHAGQGPFRFEQKLLRKPVLGVLLRVDSQAGVRIVGVTPESGAAKAGLKSGDRLTSVNGTAVAGAGAAARLDQARALLDDLDADKPVRVGYARDGRDAVVSVTPRLDTRVFMFNDADGSLAKLGGPVAIRTGKPGEFEVEADSVEVDTEAFRDGMQQAMGALSVQMPRIQTEILRLGDCKQGDTCRFPMLAEAFRWSGLNLATLDPQLGRYFGTDRGVLVLSTGGELQGLQAGDVVQRIDGKPIASPREAMAALRARPADSNVLVDYLRDRRAQSAQVKVPKADPLRIPPPPPPPPPAPPAPPAPPPPTPPTPDSASMPAPPAPPEAPRVRERRKIMLVDRNGKRAEWEGDGSTPLPEGAQRIEKRRMVFVDDNGKTTVLEGDDAPAPPTPPAPPPPPPAHVPAPPPPPPPPPPVG